MIVRVTLWKRGPSKPLSARRRSQGPQPPTKHLAEVQDSVWRPRNSYPRLCNFAIQNVGAMSLRRHPALDDRLGTRETLGDVLRDASVLVTGIVSPIYQRWETRPREDVRHFLKMGHVLSLDLGHSVQLRIVNHGGQSLSTSLSVNEVEDARLRCGQRARRCRPRRWRRRRAGGYNAASHQSSGCERKQSNAHPCYSGASAQSFQRVEDSARLEFRTPRGKDAEPTRALVKLLRQRWQIDRPDPPLSG
jgi:hypothetical protein